MRADLTIDSSDVTRKNLEIRVGTTEHYVGAQDREARHALVWSGLWFLRVRKEEQGATCISPKAKGHVKAGSGATGNTNKVNILYPGLPKQ